LLIDETLPRNFDTRLIGGASILFRQFASFDGMAHRRSASAYQSAKEFRVARMLNLR
jgi:hypothetical protein